ncbi:hypothetical protein MOQ72_30380 [Saccharopolyspora sp. K220]|uniref:hypothetical protein n=1 Tax=Saccharopolyspora soli TaxID=2926618 RepID=UPI001F59E2D1|nr:hypothetical protein [Saccharopolyspora soli]MCI2421752.1 hypothetical protein [Saccharopolyspora soli]
MSVTVVRKTPLVLGMLLASVIALAVLAPSQWMALALFSMSYGFLMIGGPSIGFVTRPAPRTRVP